MVTPRAYPGTAVLEQIQQRVLWLATRIVDAANHDRDTGDGVKVGGHQASSASLVTAMTALYFAHLDAPDRVSVKPHASPVFHAIQYLLGNLDRSYLPTLRAFGGLQSYPSRTKDPDGVDFSTGSVGLGAAAPLFAAATRRYVNAHFGDRPRSRFVALIGDAELDEGNVFEALLEGWKHDVRNLWWVIDYNRQSLDSIVNDRLFNRIDSLFEMMGWRVVTLKYGKRLEAAFARPDGEHLRQWIDECPNSRYSALVYKGGAGWREHLSRDLNRYPGIRRILDEHDDEQLHHLMTNLAGHDMEAVLEAFHGIEDDLPTCFIAYTIKGHGLPFAGHKDNHAGLMNKDQMAGFKAKLGIADGAEWDRFAGARLPAAELEAFLAEVPFAADGVRQHVAAPVPVADLPVPQVGGSKASTQEGFGKILNDLAGGDSPLASRIVTTSPDVTVSTNLGGWVNRRGIFHREEVADTFRDEKVVSAQRWAMAPTGQHLELGIAEHNLFLMLAALGLTAPLFGARLLPIGTLYDPFINRGLDALNYGCYQDSRFMVVATPSGLTLAPEGGAHQSINTPLIGMGQDGLASYEPAYVDELGVLMAWGFEHMQKPAGEGGSIYLRLSTRSIEQPERPMTAELRDGIVSGAYWLVEPEPGVDLAIVYCGAVAEEAKRAHAAILEDIPGAGLLAVTSPDRLHANWLKHRQIGRAHV